MNGFTTWIISKMFMILVGVIIVILSTIVIETNVLVAILLLCGGLFLLMFSAYSMPSYPRDI